MPGHVYEREHVRHRDSMRRVKIDREEDNYLSPFDGHLATLVVQSTDDIYNGPANSTWRRTYMQHVTPRTIRLANRLVGNAPSELKNKQGKEKWKAVKKWAPTCLTLLFLLHVRIYP